MRTKNGSKRKSLALLQKLEQNYRHYFGYGAYKLQQELNDAEGKQSQQDQVEVTQLLGGQEADRKEDKALKHKRKAYNFGTQIS